ncbi:MAG: hypothetical protein IJM62_03535 [Lachnospiraceae bacterium]|nr:hypothetical protein [Lachnospiraceae bacterium]
MKKLICFIAACFLAAMMPGTALADMGTVPDMTEKTEEACEALLGEDTESGETDDAAADLRACALALYGKGFDAEEYLDLLWDRMTERLSGTSSQGEMSPAEIQRIVLTVLMLGGDPSAFGTYPDGTPADLAAMCMWDLRGGDLGDAGAEAVIGALILADSGMIDIPDGTGADSDSLLKLLISMQNDEGGFGTAEDDTVYLTARALQALAAHRDDPEAAACIDGAFAYLSGVQSDTGGFPGMESYEECGNTAEVLMALIAFEIDPAEDSGFVKKGNTVIDALMRFRRDDGTYRRTAEDDAGDSEATAKAALAMETVRIMKEEGRFIYDLRSYEPPVKNYKRSPGKEAESSGTGESSGEEDSGNAPGDAGSDRGSRTTIYIFAGIAAALLAALAAVFIKRSKGKKGD